jgi:hypothetical protein
MSKPSVLAVAYRLAPSMKSAILFESSDILIMTKVELEMAAESSWIERHDEAQIVAPKLSKRLISKKLHRLFSVFNILAR